MRKLYCLISALLVFLLSCSDSSDRNVYEDPVTELALNQNSSGTISRAGEVDWYHYRVNDANRVLKVECSSNTYRPDVDLLVTVYELDGQGNKVVLYSDHAIEDGQLPADIKMYIYINDPKDIYISVRDLLDDDFSETEEYYISIDFEDGEDGNNNFTDAVSVTVDDANTCQTDAIESIGDVDCYKFQAPSDGVYNVQVDFTPYQGGTSVMLTVDVYDGSGILVESLNSGQGDEYHLLLALASGEYYVLIDENGKDDYDTASTYQICVDSVACNEVLQNDTSADATSVTFASPMVISGSLDYMGDQDWYGFPLSGGGGYEIIDVTFQVEDVDFDYRINVQDSGETLLLTHDQSGGSSPYQTQIKAGSGDHYVMIEAADGQEVSQSVSYTVTVLVTEVNDPDDIADIGNSPGTAVELTTDTPPAAGTYIGYRGDEDWYKITVPPASPAEAQVLEVFLDNSGASLVEYYVSIILDSNVVNKTYDTTGEDGATHLKMSVLVPESADPLTYYFLVRDYQGDDGDVDVPYTIYANYRQFPATLADLPADLPYSDPAVTQYHGEAGELDESTTITLQHSSIEETDYKVNTSLLDFHGGTPPSWITITQDTPEVGQTTIEFPWIAGYIDYQRDMDFFRVNLGPLNGADTDWYYDIKMEMHVASGSQVEYTWEFYRDSNQDEILVDRPSSSSCIFAANGDTDPTDFSAVDISNGPPADEFYVGDGWADSSPLFYIGIRDFDYVDNPPDDDWGYGVPYYFRLTLIYHSGESYPGENDE